MEDNLVGKYQRRYFDPGELRLDGDREKHLFGYAAVFNVLSQDMMGFREKIAKGAFAESIKSDDVKALWNHNPDEILGRNKSGTLKLWEDEKGLGFEITLPNTQRAHDLMESVKRRDVTQNSFGFMLESVKHESWNETQKIRTLNRVKLFDVSPVTYAAYIQTELGVRSNFYILNSPQSGLATVKGQIGNKRIAEKIDRFLLHHKIKELKKYFEGR